MVDLTATSVDDPAARSLLTDYFRTRADTFPGHTYTTVFPAPEVFEPPRGVFVVVTDDAGTPIGCGGVREIAAGALGPRFEVKHLYLAPATRGRGWGRMLLADLEHRAAVLGAAEVVLDTHHTLAPAARLYAAAGFTPIEAYNDNPNATVWLGKALG
ncbi:GNAT superfamily N-acetyltransferase [Microbacterium sp. AK009]|uniref:GNAT family N-acetyltransferase n=1 Tax=Microbacterium sp. AK009 TaxID=2723068 RepID=UPI0015CE88B1|nr:GNAT family N-acetyltransferase [Microbacterium sp. AK009]NYF16443.1 GNAT superfamily N-acetyltransferase [Microbacterium sp. AK009]